MGRRNEYPKGWTEARIRRVIEHYDSQADEEAAAEIEAGLARTTMEVPIALVPVVRKLIAKRRSTSATKGSSKTRVRANKRRAA